MEMGNSRISDVEYQMCLSMWAIMTAPLIAGNTLRNMDWARLEILTAPKLIAIDQYPLASRVSASAASRA
jgi:alpha-galactosidase